MKKERRMFQNVDEKTGEVITTIEFNPGDTIYSKEQKENYARLKNRQKELRANNSDFVWVKFKYNQKLFPALAPGVLTRLFIFATYCSENQYVMRNDEIGKCLSINSNQLSIFRKELFGNIIENKNNSLYLHNSLFGKGSIKKSEKSNRIRLHTKATQILYNECEKTSEHQYLAYFFLMIPFVNRQYNILCHNQTESGKDNIKCMPATEFFDLLKKTHSARIKKQLQKYRIDGELVIGYFNDFGRLVPDGKYVIINPLLFYGGDPTKQSYMEIRKVFEEECQQHHSDD